MLWHMGSCMTCQRFCPFARVLRKGLLCGLCMIAYLGRKPVISFQEGEWGLEPAAAGGTVPGWG